MSGWQQSPGETRVPSSLEIAIVSGRICRYAGNLPCSLLTHVMVGARVVWGLMRQRTKEERLQTFSWWMLHDAHEVITGDFVPHKCDEVSEWQAQIDRALSLVYRIPMELVDMVVVHDADLYSRALEAGFYGTEKFKETFGERAEIIVPSPAMVRETGGIFRSDFGKLSVCVTDENGSDAGIRTPVLVYKDILEAILEGHQETALLIYDGAVVELGL